MNQQWYGLLAHNVEKTGICIRVKLGSHIDYERTGQELRQSSVTIEDSSLYAATKRAEIFRTVETL